MRLKFPVLEVDRAQDHHGVRGDGFFFLTLHIERLHEALEKFLVRSPLQVLIELGLAIFRRRGSFEFLSKQLCYLFPRQTRRQLHCKQKQALLRGPCSAVRHPVG